MYNQIFSQDYEIMEENYGRNFQTKSAYKINSVKRKQNSSKCNTQEYLISVHFPKSINLEIFSKLKRFKYISIIQPETYYQNENEHILIYFNYLSHQLNQRKMQELKSDADNYYRIFLQVAFLFAELETRKYNWQIESIEQLYYFHGLLLISLADYDFNQRNLNWFDQFLNLTNKDFPEQYREIQEKNLKNFQNVVDYFGKQRIKEFNQKGNNNTSYENVLKYLLQIEKFDRVNDEDANSDVKKFEIPSYLLDIHPELKQQNQNEKQECIYKATKMVKAQQTLILKRIDREIDNMEKNQSQYIAVFSLYFRIFQTSYLIMKKYQSTLQETLDDWQIKDENLLRCVYAFSFKFARSLDELHYQGFLHRDLKPDNLFFNNLDLAVADVFIGDLDRSKRLAEYEDFLLTTGQKEKVLNTTLNYCNQKMYNPPEDYKLEENKQTYDVFQYGIILLQVANKGQYVGNKKIGTKSLFVLNQFDEFYSPQAITKALSQYNYDKDFVDLIIKCLSKDPSTRPDSSKIRAITKQFHQKYMDLEQKVDQAQNIENKIRQLQQILINHFNKEYKGQ